MAIAAATVQAVGSHIQGGGLMMQGLSAKEKAKFEAKQMLRNARSIEALGQREAAAERLKGEEVASAARARMAAGGGGVDSQIIGDIRDKAEYNALASLYNRYTEADIMQDEAKIRKKEGKQAWREARLGAVGSFLSSNAGSIANIADAERKKSEDDDDVPK